MGIKDIEKFITRYTMRVTFTIGEDTSADCIKAIKGFYK